MTPRVRAALLVLLALVTLAATAPTATAFENGRAPQDRLAKIFTPQPGKVAYLVSGGPAASWNTMNLCAASSGKPLSPGNSVHAPAATAYRTYRLQQVLFAQLGPRLAARPGRSNHGNERGAVDLRAPPMQTYVRQRGGTFGWRWGEVPHEWWHVSRIAGARFTRPDPGASFRYPRLKRGSGGPCQAPAVRELQRRLGITRDGEFGKGTTKALRSAQKAKPFRSCLKKKKLKRSPLGIVQSPEWICLRKITRKSPEKDDGTTVRPNAQGQDVRAVQGLLAARLRELNRPKSVCKVDGTWDDCDKRALKKFQHLVGLKVTGVAGPKDYAALRKPRGSARRLDSEGLQFLAREEGVRTKPYNDSAGHCTVGIGHLVHHGRCTPGDFTRYREFRLAHAFTLLKRDVAPRERVIVTTVSVRRKQGEFNASLSLLFNIGEGGWRKSTVRRKWNAGDRRGAADAFRLWHIGGRPGELLPRRNRERAMFLRP